MNDDSPMTVAQGNRIIQLLEQIAASQGRPPFPPPPSDTRAFLDSLRGMSTEEIVAATRERNRRLKEAAT